MLQALCEAEIAPELIVGTSIGAINGAMFAVDPSEETVEQLTDLWITLDGSGAFGGNMLDRVKTVLRTRTTLHENDHLREILSNALSVERIEDLAVRFECVAASIERATAKYFSQGPIVDAVLASSAVPGLLPPVEIDGEHFLDGGLVASIPLDRAVELGATTIYVLQVGRIEEPLVAPTKPWEVALISFEIARRHRFSEAMQNLPAGVSAHVLPTGDSKAFNDLRQYSKRSGGGVSSRIATSRIATLRYLRDRELKTDAP